MHSIPPFLQVCKLAFRGGMVPHILIGCIYEADTELLSIILVKPTGKIIKLLSYQETQIKKTSHP